MGGMASEDFSVDPSTGEVLRVDPFEEDRRKRSHLNELLLRNARRSLAETSELTGVPVGELAERYARLFEDRGWLTERQEERLLLIELGDFLDGVRDELEASRGSKEYASIARVALGSMQLMANRFDNRKAIVDSDLQRITQAQARLFGSAFDVALNSVVEGLMAAHPDISFEEVEVLTGEGLSLAREKMAGAVIV